MRAGESFLRSTGMSRAVTLPPIPCAVAAAGALFQLGSLPLAPPCRGSFSRDQNSTADLHEARCFTGFLQQIEAGAAYSVAVAEVIKRHRIFIHCSDSVV
jgi:hypothetical protein